MDRLKLWMPRKQDASYGSHSPPPSSTLTTPPRSYADLATGGGIAYRDVAATSYVTALDAITAEGWVRHQSRHPSLAMPLSQRVMSTALPDVDYITPGDPDVAYVTPIDVQVRLKAAQYAAGKKFDSGKAPVGQAFLGYFRKAVEAVARISEYGANKYAVAYSEQNWRKVDNAKGRYLDALVRHTAAHAAGELLDPDSGHPHMAHAAWNALALLELE